MARPKKDTEEEIPVNKYDGSPLWDLGAVDDDVIEKLDKAGIHTLQMLRATPAEELMTPMVDGGAGLTEERAEKLAKQVRAKINPIEIIKSGDIKPIEYIPTGSNELDRICGGGYAVTETTEIAADYGMGKTMMCCVAAVLCWEKSKKDTLFINTETQQVFDRSVLSNIAKARGITDYDVDNHLHYSRCLDVDDQLWNIKHIDSFIKENNIKLLVIDSFGANLRPEMQGRGFLGKRQQLAQFYAKNLSRIANVFDLAIIVTNQIIATPDPYAPTFNPAFGGSLQYNVGKLIGIQGTSEKGAKEGYGNPYHKNIKDTGIRALTVIKGFGLPVTTVMCKLTDKGLEDV